VRLVAAVIDLDQGRYANGALRERLFVHLPENGENLVEIPFDDPKGNLPFRIRKIKENPPADRRGEMLFGIRGAGEPAAS
jgi:hypothetical protein